MKSVTLDGTRLTITVDDNLVFDRHVSFSDPKLDAKVRYAAWDACPKGSKVFAGFVGGTDPAFVIVDRYIYNPEDAPRPVSSPQEDEIKRKRAQMAESAKKKRESIRKKNENFEIVPKHHAGVDYGAEQRVLVRTLDRVVLWARGHTSYVDRMSGSLYVPGELSVCNYGCRGERTSKTQFSYGGDGGYRLVFSSRQEIKVPLNFRMNLLSIRALIPEMEKALMLRAGTIEKTGWHGEKTLVLCQ